MTSLPPDTGPAAAPRRRRLRAVFAADVANFGGLVAVDETRTLDGLTLVRRIANESLALYGGWLFGLPGDGIFALFESAVDAVRCALDTQARLAGVAQLDAIKLRIGIHLGEVVFENELPFGEALVIAARLESLAEPGGILVSSAVRDAVALRIGATFEDQGVRPLKHSPRLVATFSVTPPRPGGEAPAPEPAAELLPEPAKAEAPEPFIDLAHVPTAAGEPAAGPAVSRVDPEPEREAPPAPLSPPRPGPSLPRVEPFVVPASVLDETMGRTRRKLDRTQGRLNRTRSTAGPPPEVQACVADFTQALTTHLGPIARVLVKRFAASATSAQDLADRLAAEVAAEAERRDFVEAARRIIRRVAPRSP